jgi:hypothetical protein
MRVGIALFGLLLLSCCTHSEFIVLKNPVTGQVVDCHTDSGSSLFPIAQTMIDNTASDDCAKGYEASGFQRMN